MGQPSGSSFESGRSPGLARYLGSYVGPNAYRPSLHHDNIQDGVGFRTTTTELQRCEDISWN